MKGGEGDMNEVDSKKSWDEAEKIFELMKPKIVSLVKRRIRFDNSIEFDDAIQQSRIALYDMVKRHYENHVTENGASGMNKETFAYWFIEKHLQTIIDYNRVVYYKTDNDTGEVEMMYGKEYIRERRKQYNQAVESIIVRVFAKDSEEIKIILKSIIYAKNEGKALQIFESFKNSALGRRYLFLMNDIQGKILNLRKKYSVSSCYGLSNSVDSILDNANHKNKLNGG